MKNTKKEFRIFFSQFFAPVCSFVRHYTKDKETAEDITQEVFVRTYEKWNEFQGQENAKAFLYTIARNLSFDHLKHRKAENNYITAFPENNETIQQNFLREVTRQETFRILYNAIDTLPGQTRRVILHSLEGNSVQEIGQKMGISVNTVKTLKKNAYSALRRTLSAEYTLLLALLLGEL